MPDYSIDKKTRGVVSAEMQQGDAHVTLTRS